MSTRWARTALCMLAVAAASLLSMGGGAATPAGAAVQTAAGTPPLTLTAQTSWVTPVAPWFTAAFSIGESGVPAADLHVSLTFYSRVGDPSQFSQAIGAVPQKSELLRVPPVPVTGNGSVRTASACVTVLPDSSASAPAAGGGTCAPGDPTLLLDCTPDTGVCGDVYPVSVALLRQGDATPLARLTTFLTYQEPEGPVGADGPLRVGLIAPVLGTGAPVMAGVLAAHPDVPVTLAVSPRTAAALAASHTQDDTRALAQLSSLSSDEVLSEPYIPVNLAALSEARIAGEIKYQLARGTQLLQKAGLHPQSGLWVDTASSFSQGDAGDLAGGLGEAGTGQLVLNDGNLASAASSNPTFAQPFSLDLGSGTDPTALASNGSLSAFFTASRGDPVLAAEQLLAGLSFVHFENTFEPDARGVVISPPSHWRASAVFMDTLLKGLTLNPALKPQTLSDLMSQVPTGGNKEPATRRLQPGPAGHSITRAAGQKIAVDRHQLFSFGAAAGEASELTPLADQLLGTEAQGLSPVRRSSALTAYARSFDGTTRQITLATERTVTFTAREAAIPVTVLSAAPYRVHVVLTLASDKFVFPDGNTRQLVLDPSRTTSVRVTAEARTSGNRLPIEVTLQTPDGQLLIAHTVLTVHSTTISFVGIALTAVAGAVLLVWWVRTWRRSRRQRPRPHPRAA